MHGRARWRTRLRERHRGRNAPLSRDQRISLRSPPAIGQVPKGSPGKSDESRVGFTIWRLMRVRFWGTRGSVPTPGQSTVRYGGNTACVELRTNAGAFIIFDSGTGIRELGLHLARQGGPVSAHLMLGHTHWDHISGFPFFTPLFVPGNHVTIYGARDLDRSLRDVLAGQMHYTYFPVPLVDLRADIEFSELEHGGLII